MPKSNDYKKAEIVAVTVKRSRSPDNMKERAFVGRSMWKNFPLNLLPTGRKLAKISGSPGKTGP
jgi:GTP-binding protein EngB required for normal cell division